MAKKRVSIENRKYKKRTFYLIKREDKGTFFKEIKPIKGRFRAIFAPKRYALFWNKIDAQNKIKELKQWKILNIKNIKLTIVSTTP